MTAAIRPAPPATPHPMPKPSSPGLSGVTPAQRAQVVAKAKELEGVFLGQMVQLMMQGLDEGGPFGGGPGEAQWRDTLAQEYGNAIADNGGIGLATRLEREMLTAMGAVNAAGSHVPTGARADGAAAYGANAHHPAEPVPTVKPVSRSWR